MSTATAPAPVASSLKQDGSIRRHRTGLLVGAALVVATVASIVAGSRPGYSEDLDPGNASPDGARAVARVLGHEGVEVDIVRDADSLDEVRIDAGTTVVVTSVGNLGPSTADRLLQDARGAHVVLVDPPVGTLGIVGLEEGARIHRPGTVKGSCADPRFDDLRVRVDRATAFPAADGSCFGTEDGALLTTDPSRSLTVLGAGQLLSNDQVTRADNAAVALRLLGARDRVVWYVPDLQDLVATDSVGLGSLLPDWLVPALWLVALVMIAVIVWRGRRLGPLVTEPLPVSITAIESTESRGRLYRKVSDRRHAADVLRRAARTRIAAHLRLPRATQADVDALARAVSAHSGEDLERVRALLSPGGVAPRTDKDLTQLANDLAELDREVRRS